MNTRKAKIRKGRFILAMMIFTLSIFGKYDDSIRAEALPDFPPGVDLVSAADCIMSYMTSAGTFIANRDWIDELYTSFGGGAGFYINDLYQNGLLTLDEAGHYVSTGLESALESQSAWSSLHLDELFRVSAEEAAVGGGVAATGAGTIAGAIGGVATTGALPLAIGVTGAYWGGIGLGTLIAHATGLYGEKVSKGVDVTTLASAVQSVPVGGRGVQYISTNNTPRFLSLPSGVIVCEYQTSNNWQIEVVNLNSTNVTCQKINLNNGSVNSFNVLGVAPSGNFWSAQGYNYSGRIGQRVFSTEQDFTNFTNQVRSGEVTKDDFPVYSPDVITPDGNARANVGQNGEITIPSMVPEVDPTGQSIVPGGASQDDWLRWANGVKGNNTNNDPDANADILQQILEAIRTNSPSPGGNPNPNPNPNPDPTPTPVPKPDYDPSQPEQPEYDPKETEGPSDVTNGSPWTTPDLLDKFPFCLPRDVLRCFEKLDGGSRIAPSISWHFTTPLGIPFNFDLNLNDYEGIASLLRTLELIAFIIGLAIATRNLIGR